MSAAKREYERWLQRDQGYVSWAKRQTKEDTEALDQDTHYHQQQEEEAEQQQAPDTEGEATRVKKPQAEIDDERVCQGGGDTQGRHRWSFRTRMDPGEEQFDHVVHRPNRF